MAEAGAFAYPVVLAAMYGVARVGRGERWGVYEWMRLGALALLLGIVVAVQVKLVMLGAASQPVPLVTGLISLLGTAALVGMYLWERWRKVRAG